MKNPDLFLIYAIFYLAKDGYSPLRKDRAQS